MRDFLKANCFIVFGAWLWRESGASAGDRSSTFRTCLKICHEKNCGPASERIGNDGPLEEEVALTETHVELWRLTTVKWNCEDECKYKCMWRTVDDFQQHNFSVPQFYGKWPFVRVFGIQEPLSAFCSVLNGVAHIWMLQEFVDKVPRRAPMFRVWCIYALMSMNGWFWSAVFHTRDFPLTEKLDYFSAFAGLLTCLCAFWLRVVGSDRVWKWMVPEGVALLYFLYHTYYLSFVDFDYGYNMMANVSVGIANSVGWLLFCLVYTATGTATIEGLTINAKMHESYRRNGWKEANTVKHPGIWKCALAVIILVCLMSLELLDFPPFWWSVDAHSLWHLGTIPIPLLWYRFLIDDCRYLMAQEQQKRHVKQI